MLIFFTLDAIQLYIVRVMHAILCTCKIPSPKITAYERTAETMNKNMNMKMNMNMAKRSNEDSIAFDIEHAFCPYNIQNISF